MKRDHTTSETSDHSEVSARELPGARPLHTAREHEVLVGAINDDFRPAFETVGPIVRAANPQLATSTITPDAAGRRSHGCAMHRRRDAGTPERTTELAHRNTQCSTELCGTPGHLAFTSASLIRICAIALCIWESYFPAMSKFGSQYPRWTLVCNFRFNENAISKYKLQSRLITRGCALRKSAGRNL